MDSKTAVKLMRNNIPIPYEKYKQIADFIEQQSKQIESMKEILGDVLSDCYLSDGMRSEIEKRI